MICQLCRAMAAKHPGVLTHVGLDTYMDPRQEGGRMNARTTEPLVELVEPRAAWLFYSAPSPPDVAIIRGTTADEDGNVSLEHEPRRARGSRSPKPCTIRRHRDLPGEAVVRRGALHPQMVRIPGFLIDHVVHDPGQRQNYGTVYDPPVRRDPRAGRDARARPAERAPVIPRRAALELRPAPSSTSGSASPAGIPDVPPRRASRI